MKELKNVFEVNVWWQSAVERRVQMLDVKSIGRTPKRCFIGVDPTSDKTQIGDSTNLCNSFASVGLWFVNKDDVSARSCYLHLHWPCFATKAWLMGEVGLSADFLPRL